MKQVFRFSNVLACIMCCLIFIGQASAKSPDDEAAQLFQNKQYKEALNIWYGLVRSGNVGAGIYYNIGISESLIGHTPEAVLAFELALRFKPADKKINEALAIERKKIEQAVIPVPTFFLFRWVKSTFAILRPGYWTMLGLVIFLLLLIWMLKYKQRIPKKGDTERRLVLTVLAAGILCLLCGWFSYRQIYRMDEAIVVAESIFRQAPSDDSPQIRIIYPGEKVILADQIGDWYQVRLLNLDEGWMKSELLEVIRLDEAVPAKE